MISISLPPFYFPRTFSLDNNDVLLLYIQNQLLPKTDGRVDETPLKLKLQRVQSAISLIKLEDKLLKTLLEIFEKVCIKSLCNFVTKMGCLGFLGFLMLLSIYESHHSWKLFLLFPLRHPANFDKWPPVAKSGAVSFVLKVLHLMEISPDFASDL